MSLADVILVIHFLYVLFVVGSLPLIWVGAYFNWSFVRNPRFRYLHLAAILFVVAESLAGVVCPLTTLENTLRQIESDSSFVQYWVHKIIFYRLPESVFTMVYITFAALIAATFKWIPPEKR